MIFVLSTVAPLAAGLAQSWIWARQWSWVIAAWGATTVAVFGQATNGLGSTDQLLLVQGRVEVQRAGTGVWVPAVQQQKLAPGDRVRTGERSRAEVWLGIGMTIRKGELSEIEIPPSREPTPLRRGLFQIFNRQQPGGSGSRFRLPNSASAAIRGTDFQVRIAPDGSAEVVVLDGEVTLENPAGEVRIQRRERGLAGPGRPPSKSPVVEALTDLVQWTLYYPAVVESSEFELKDPERLALAGSLAAYEAGDLVAAAELYPWDRADVAPAEALYRGALLLSLGQIERAQAALARAPDRPAVRALTRLIAAVKLETPSTERQPATASEWLAESYVEQARHRLESALAAAVGATTLAPRFGFAWARRAELEFSFGRRRAAGAALTRALALSPRHPPGLTLDGFLRLADGRSAAAMARFDQAIAVDAAFGHAWLGRGLGLIHQGRAKDGQRDLLVAASLEPQRSLLRSYLGKAFSLTSDPAHAERELELAAELDPRDPTPWLYAALLRQQQNDFNRAMAALERSQALNDHRQIYRSRQLLDADRAVRSASLAGVYQDAGMPEVSLREAARAAVFEPGNYSAHLFLADSYDLLRDPTRFNLRYETVWFNELLLANLLAPAGAGRLSQGISSHEYSRLFESDGLGLASESRLRSDGIFSQRASQFGSFGRSAYALDLDYRHQDGVRPNHRLDSLEWYTTFKHQITPEDAALVLVKYQDYQSGDNFQYYDPRDARRHFQFDERQEPIVAGAWHHEWGPGMHTLLMGARLINRQEFSDRAVPQIILLEDASGAVVGSDRAGLDVESRNTLEVYSAELTQLADSRWASLIAGGRYQSGEIRTRDALTNPDRLPFLFATPPAGDLVEASLERITAYGYVTMKPWDSLRLIGGVAWERETIPGNFRHPPVTAGEDDRSQLGPKVGFVWMPFPVATLRGVYTRSLGGVSLDQSYRLEPTQLAGFPQAFRTLIPESVAGVGSVSAPAFTTLGLALDLKFDRGTYVGIKAEHLQADVRRRIGVFTVENGGVPARPDSVAERLEFDENSLAITVNQLLGDRFVAGLHYTLSQAVLDDDYVSRRVPNTVLSPATRSADSTLHRAGGYLLFHHPSGWYARAEAVGYSQANAGYSPALPGTSVVQEHLYVGYHFFRGRADVRLGVLNLSDEDYRLNPLTAYEEMPRERLLEARLSFRF